MPDTLSPVYWTADTARRLPEDGNRYEVVYGELLGTPAAALASGARPAPGRCLAKYLEANPARLVLTSPADISWGADVLVQPDVSVVPTEQGERSSGARYAICRWWPKC